MGKDVECPVCHGLIGVDPDVFVPGLPIRCRACGKWYLVTKVVPDESQPGTTRAALMTSVDALPPEDQERLWREHPEFSE